MMRSAVASLVSWTITHDDIEQEVKTESTRDVFCKVSSISRQEWADAGRIGLKPQLKLLLPTTNYSNEMVVDFEGKRYEVYRTYTIGDQMELYLELKGGSDGQ